MNTIACWLALLTVVMVPPFSLVWLVVHSLVGFWRPLGPFRTCISLLSFTLPAVELLGTLRETRMRVQ